MRHGAVFDLFHQGPVHSNSESWRTGFTDDELRLLASTVERILLYPSTFPEVGEVFQSFRKVMNCCLVLFQHTPGKSSRSPCDRKYPHLFPRVFASAGMS